jgi:hypothetical protein
MTNWLLRLLNFIARVFGLFGRPGTPPDVRLVQPSPGQPMDAIRIG